MNRFARGFWKPLRCPTDFIACPPFISVRTLLVKNDSTDTRRFQTDRAAMSTRPRFRVCFRIFWATTTTNRRLLAAGPSPPFPGRTCYSYYRCPERNDIILNLIGFPAIRVIVRDRTVFEFYELRSGVSRARCVRVPTRDKRRLQTRGPVDPGTIIIECN